MPLALRPEGYPSSIDAIHTIGTVHPEDQAVFAYEAPSEAFIDGQLEFLTDFLDQSVLDERPELIKMARDLYTLIEGMRNEKQELDEDFVRQKGTDGEEAAAQMLVGWHECMAAVTGFVELLRVPEFEAMLRDPSILEEGDDEGVLLIDVDIHRYEQIGMVVDNPVLRRLGIPVPAVEVDDWLEGDRVYVRARRPTLVHSGRERRIHPDDLAKLQKIALTGLTARVKRTAWEST